MLNEKAMLVRMNISQWTGRKKDRRVTDETNAFYGVEVGAGYYNKFLVPKRAFNNIQKIVSSARTFHYENTLPWGDAGERLLPAANYLPYTRQMSDFRNDFEAAVAEFKAGYPDLVESARNKLNKMFNAADYPSVEEIGQKYGFQVMVTPVPAASDFRVELAAEETEAIRKDIEKQLRQAQAAAMGDLWNRLYEVVKKMADKLSEDGGIFRDSLVANVVRLTEILPRLNVAEDKRLDKLCRDIQSRLCAYSPQELRKNPRAKKLTANAANAVLDSMAGYMGYAA